MQTDMLKYSFNSDILPTGTFGVVRFEGVEGLSRCYRFEILLVSEEAEIDLRQVLANPVKLAIHRETGGDVVFHGLPISFEQLQQVGKSVFYRVVMTPKLWRLSLTRHNQVFLNKTIPEIIEACLKDGGLTALDYELRLQKDYPPWEYICQYGESHLDFISRWLEHEGLYYYFEDTDTGEKVIITDSRIAHSAMPQGLNLTYLPPSGLESAHRDEIISAFFCRQQLLPQTVILKDYNYRRPSLELTATAQVHPEGHGEVYSYGEHFRTPAEGQALAKIRAEEINCWERRFEGESSVPYLRPGYLFKLTDHYRKSFNQEYLTVLITHAGNQAGYTLSGLSATLADGERETYYRNTFTALPAQVQFRPERKTPKAKCFGMINARIDAAGSGQYAELDDQGRYKIILPFDLSGHKNGKASAWVRMAQPYVGVDHGMHFPLHKGTDVLITFIDGDPDRPIIASAVPNPETPSPVNSSNQTMANITTSGGNKIHFEDQAGNERILMHSSKQNSFVRIGAPNDPPAAGDDQHHSNTTDSGIAKKTDGWLSIEAQAENSIILGEAADIVLALRIEATIAAALPLAYNDFVFGGRWETHWPNSWSFKNFHHEVEADHLRAAVQHIVAHAASQKMVGVEATIRTNALEAAVAKLNVLEDNIDTFANELSNVATNVQAVENDVSAHGISTRTAGNKIAALTNSLHTAGTNLRTAGSSIKNIGQQIDNQGTGIKNSGANIKQAGTIMETAALTLKN